MNTNQYRVESRFSLPQRSLHQDRDDALVMPQLTAILFEGPLGELKEQFPRLKYPLPLWRHVIDIPSQSTALRLLEREDKTKEWVVVATDPRLRRTRLRGE